MLLTCTCVHMLSIVDVKGHSIVEGLIILGNLRHIPWTDSAHWLILMMIDISDYLTSFGLSTCLICSIILPYLFVYLPLIIQVVFIATAGDISQTIPLCSHLPDLLPRYLSLALSRIWRMNWLYLIIDSISLLLIDELLIKGHLHHPLFLVWN